MITYLICIQCLIAQCPRNMKLQWPYNVTAYSISIKTRTTSGPELKDNSTETHRSKQQPDKTEQEPLLVPQLITNIIVGVERSIGI